MDRCKYLNAEETYLSFLYNLKNVIMIKIIEENLNQFIIIIYCIITLQSVVSSIEY